MPHAPTKVPTPAGLAAGKLPIRFGDLELLRLKSADDRGEVYVATWPDGVDKLCVVNLLGEGTLRDTAALDQLKAQASWLVRRVHGNLVQIYDVGEAEGRFFFASELVEGRDLESLLERAQERGHVLPPELAVHVAMEVALALDFVRASEQKATGVASTPVGLGAPSVLLGVDGNVKVMHYGAALAPRPDELDESMIARASLVAPECARGEAASARSDVFALGALLWQCLAGRPLAHAGVGATLSAMRAGTWTPPVPGAAAEAVPVDETLSQIVMTALAPDAAARPENVTVLRGQLSAYRKAHELAAGPAELRALVTDFFGRELAEEAASLTGLAARYVAAARGGTHNTLTSFDSHRRRTPVPIQDDLPAGEVITGTRYRVLGKIGEGGMGTVYAAEHIDIERRVALKLLHAELLKNPAVLQQFRQEARAASRIGNPYICDVTDWGEVQDGRVFFVMEYLDGTSLGREIRRVRKVSPARTIAILRQVCKALGAAHEKGIVHLDVKPDNVLLMERGGRSDSVKVVDFGIAGLLGQGGASGKVMGTPEYMAPERTQGRSDAVTDIYALGIMAYEMLAGEVPFQGQTPVETLAMHSMDLPAPFRERSTSAVPAALEAVIFRMLDKDPYRRPQTMAEVERQLLEAQTESGLRTDWDDLPLPEMPEMMARKLRRKLGVSGDGARLRLFTVVAAGVAAIAVSFAAYVMMREREVVLVVDKNQPEPAAEAARLTSPMVIPSAIGQLATEAPDEATAETPPTTAESEHRSARAKARREARAAAQAAARPETSASSSPPAAKPADPFDNPARVGGDRALAKEAADRGQVALESGRLLQAKKDFEAARAADPGYAPALAGLAEVAFEESQYRRAAQLAAQASRFAPGRTQYLVILGDAHYKLGELAEALQAYKQALASKPDSATIKERIKQVEDRLK